MSRFAMDSFKPTRIEVTGGPRSSAAGAADNVNLGDYYGALEKRKPRYDQQAADWIENRANEENTITAAIANTYSQGLRSKADVYESEVKSKAAIDASNTARNAQRTASGIGAFTTIAAAAIPLMSDESTKHTVDRIEDACELLRQLNPVTFYYKEEYSSRPERMHYGFIAQEYQKVMPDATYYDESIGKLCIDPVELIGLLVRANQQLEIRIARLEAKQALAGVK